MHVYTCFAILLRDHFLDLLHIHWKGAYHTRPTFKRYFVTLNPRPRSTQRPMSPKCKFYACFQLHFRDRTMDLLHISWKVASYTGSTYKLSFVTLNPWSRTPQRSTTLNAIFMHVLKYSSETVCWMYFIYSGKLLLISVQHMNYILWPWTQCRGNHKGLGHQSASFVHALQYFSETVCCIYFIFSGKGHLIPDQYINYISWPWTQGQGHHKGQHHQNASFMHTLQYSSETVCWMYFIFSGKVHLVFGQHKNYNSWPCT